MASNSVTADILKTLNSSIPNNFDITASSLVDQPKAPNPAKPCTVSGIVVWIQKSENINGVWNKPDFIIETSKQHLRFYCEGYTGGGYCRIDAEDLIEAEGWYTPSTKDNVSFDLRLTKIPLIEPAVTKTAIIKVIHHCFPRQGRLLLGEAERVYEKLDKLTSDIPQYADMETPHRVNIYLTRLSTEYKDKPKDSDAPDKLYPEMEKKDAMKLLRDWYDKRVYRQLRMIGLTYEEIKDSYFVPTILYEKLKRNPYTVPFISLDRAQELSIRFRLGVTRDKLRMGEILREIYKNTMSSSWCGTPPHILRKKFPDFNDYKDALTAELDEERTPGGWGIRIGEVGGLELACLTHCYEVEFHVKNHLVQMITKYKDNFPGYFDPVYKMETLTNDQKGAIYGALNHPLSVITGGGGSGKTTCITEIILNLENRKINFLIVSFTGKAVVRVKQVLRKAKISETLINTTYTIHRAIYKEMPIDCADITHLIIDECSMVTTELLSEFLHKFVNIRWICTVGDCNQLPPISWGSFFTEIIDSERAAVYRLTHCHRTYKIEGEEDGILENANLVANHPHDAPFRFRETKNFMIVNGDENEVKDIITSFHQSGILDHQFTVVTPYNKVKERLNRFYQEQYRHGVEEFFDSKKVPWRKGDIVLCLENNYDLDDGLFNGDEGKILEANPDYIRVSFDEEALTANAEDLDKRRYKRTYPFALKFTVDDGYGGSRKQRFRKYKGNEVEEDDGKLTTRMLARAYSKTGHKCQGSEYDYTVVYVPRDKKPSRSFLNRNWLYTAITRAKRATVLIGDRSKLEAIAKLRPLRRYEFLSAYLIRDLEKCTDGIDSRSLTIGAYAQESQAALEYFADDDDWDD